MPKSKRKSNRLKLFEIMRKAPRGILAKSLRTKLGFSPTNGQLGILLRGEIAAKRIRAEQHDVDGSDVVFYFLTAKGRKHLEQGKVDSVARKEGLVHLGRAWEKDKPRPWTNLDAFDR